MTCVTQNGNIEAMFRYVKQIWRKILDELDAGYVVTLSHRFKEGKLSPKEKLDLHRIVCPHLWRNNSLEVELKDLESYVGMKKGSIFPLFARLDFNSQTGECQGMGGFAGTLGFWIKSFNELKEQSVEITEDETCYECGQQYDRWQRLPTKIVDDYLHWSIKNALNTILKPEDENIKTYSEQKLFMDEFEGTKLFSRFLTSAVSEVSYHQGKC